MVSRLSTQTWWSGLIPLAQSVSEVVVCLITRVCVCVFAGQGPQAHRGIIPQSCELALRAHGIGHLGGNNEGFHFQVTPRNPERERWSYMGVTHTKTKTLNSELFRLKLRHICVRVWQRLEIIKTHKTLHRNS